MPLCWGVGVGLGVGVGEGEGGAIGKSIVIFNFFFFCEDSKNTAKWSER